MGGVKKLFFILLLFLIFLTSSLFSEEKPVITVLEFKANNISEADMGSIIGFLSSSIYDLGIFDVIDSGQRDTILAELSFSNSGCSDEACQLEIGKLLSAEFILVGDIGMVGDRFIVTTRMLETETSRTVGSAKGLYSNINDLVDNLHLIAEELGNKYLSGQGESVPVAEEPEPLKEPNEASISESEPNTETELPVVPEDELGKDSKTEPNPLEPEKKFKTGSVIGFIGGGVLGAGSVTALIVSAIKYDEYLNNSGSVANAETLREQVATLDLLGYSAAAGAAISLGVGLIFMLF